MTIELHHGDCLEVMQPIPDGSVDLVLTDPPYGTTACKWDTVIDLDAMWAHLKRVIKKNGAVVLFGSEPFSSHLRMSNIKEYKYDWVWVKHAATGHLNAKKRPMKKTETISVFYAGQCTYKPQGLIEINKTVQNSRGDCARGKQNKTSTVSGGLTREPFTQEHTNYPSNVLEFNSMNGNTVHPTQKPVALMEYLIKTYTNEGETVLDFTMGSGTTGVACKNTGRHFIGIELDEKYFTIANKRINDHEVQLPLIK